MCRYLRCGQALHDAYEGEEVGVLLSAQEVGHCDEAVQQLGSLQRVPGCDYCQGHSLRQVQVSAWRNKKCQWWPLSDPR